VGFETKDTARRAQPAKRLLPANGVRLVAGRRGKRIGRNRAAADETVNFFLDVDERWLHGAVKLIVCNPQSKLAAVKRRQTREEFSVIEVLPPPNKTGIFFALKLRLNFVDKSGSYL
jgi:hypothetical protein